MLNVLTKYGANFDAKYKISVLAILSSFLLVHVYGISLADPAALGRENRDLNIKTLPPDPYVGGYRQGHSDYYSSEALNSADALLSDWDGDHWASLDADLDKVALTWASTENEIIFQVRIKS